MQFRVVIISCLVGLLLFLVTACSGIVQHSDNGSASTLTYLLDNEPGNIDPQISTEDETAIVLRQIYDTLVYRDPRQETIVPGLATQWTISPDNVVYTFSLRNDVKFHDGTSFNAQAVADNFDRLSGLNASSGKAGMFFLKYYAGYELVDAFTIR